MSKMIYSRASKNQADITRTPPPGAAARRTPGEGEGFGAGTSNRVVINERPNKSINRNNGVERPSANEGMIPVVTSGVRKTGRIA